MKAVYRGVLPTIAILGILGNTLSIIILSREQFRDPIYFFLKVSDLITLVNSDE